MIAKRAAVAPLLAGLLLTVPSPGTAQGSDPPLTPEATAAALFEALGANRFEDAADLYDEASLRSWRGELVETLSRMPYLGSRPWDADSTDPQNRTMKRFFETLLSQRVSMAFAGVRTIEEAEALPIRDAAARALEASSPEGRLHASIVTMEGFATEAVSEAERREAWLQLSESIPRIELRDVVGAVVVDGEAYVVYSVRWESGAADVAILPLVRTERGWRARPRGFDLLRDPPSIGAPTTGAP